MFGIDDVALAMVGSALIGAGSNSAKNAQEVQLANTAHQREVADLRAAGINPVLTAGGGSGSATPVLSSAFGPSETEHLASAPLKNAEKSRVLAETASAVAAAENSKAHTAALRAGTDKTNTETAILNAEVPAVKAKAKAETIHATNEGNVAGSWYGRNILPWISGTAKSLAGMPAAAFFMRGPTAGAAKAKEVAASAKHAAQQRKYKKMYTPKE